MNLENNKGAAISLEYSERWLLGELEKRGYVIRVPTPSYSPEVLSQLKEALVEAQREEAMIREELRGLEFYRGSFSSSQMKDTTSQLFQRLEYCRTKGQQLRSQILTLSESSALLSCSVSISGAHYSITYKGKELIANMIPRIKRVGEIPTEKFELELEQLKNIFASRSKKSFEILKFISPRLRHVDEIHCRSASVGLSVRTDSATDIAKAFLSLMDGLKYSSIPPDRYPLVAECIAENLNQLSAENISSGISRFNYLKNLAQRYALNEYSAVDCALIMYPLYLSENEDVMLLQNSLEFAQELYKIVPYVGYEPLPTLLILLAGLRFDGVIAQKYQQICSGIFNSNVPIHDCAFATALLTISPLESHQLIDRFKSIKMYLTRFSENGMTVPAAMLSFLSSEIEETFDNLRLASSAIAQNKLSLGGMENLSLGIKMLLQSSLLSSIATLPYEQRRRYTIPYDFVPLPAIGILPILFIPVALTALTTFHELHVHKLAISDYVFHPVHTHYIYG